MNTIKIESVYFEFESWAVSHDEDDDNANVTFKLSDGTEWAAVFFTYQNILSLRKKNGETGECLNGLYFCAADMILIERLNRESILKVLEEMLKNDEIGIYCTRING